MKKNQQSLTNRSKNNYTILLVSKLFIVSIILFGYVSFRMDKPTNAIYTGIIFILSIAILGAQAHITRKKLTISKNDVLKERLVFLYFIFLAIMWLGLFVPIGSKTRIVSTCDVIPYSRTHQNLIFGGTLSNIEPDAQDTPGNRSAGCFPKKIEYKLYLF